LTFSGPRILSTDEVCHVIIGLLDRPRPEVAIPWSRGFIARTSTLLPGFLRRWVIGRLTRKGLARQKEIRRMREAGG